MTDSKLSLLHVTKNRKKTRNRVKSKSRFAIRMIIISLSNWHLLCWWWIVAKVWGHVQKLATSVILPKLGRVP